MAVLALAVVGAGAGFYAGIALGATTAVALGSDILTGFSIGAEVGSMVQAASQHYYTASMGRLNDLVVTVASYGTSIPQCWGSNRVPGIVIWGTTLIEHEQDVNSGGGGSLGGPTVTTQTYTYTVSMAVAFCSGAPNTLNTVQRIYMNDLIVYDITVTPNVNLFSPRFYQGTETQSADALIISSASNSDLPAGTDNPAFRGLNYMLLQDLPLTADFNDGIPQMSADISTGQCSVAQVITDVAAQVGINPSYLDVSQVENIYVTGLMVSSRIDGRSALQPILDAYHVDLVDIDGKTVAVPRGGSSVATITYADMGAKTINSGSVPADQHIVKTRTDTLSLPKRIDVGYYSPTINFQSAVQSAIRQSAPNNIYQSIQYPLTLLDSEAKQLAERILYLAWVERNGYKSSLMPKWAALTPTDVIMIQTDSTGTMRRVRIINAEVAPAGEIKMDFVADDDNTLIQSQIVASQPGNSVTTYQVINTNFFAWSGVELTSNDSTSPGFYVAAKGASTGWSGASIYMSTDGGTTWVPMGTVTNSSVFGTCNAALGHSTYTPDSNGFDASVNQVTVTVNGTLGSLSEANILLGAGNTALITQSNQAIANTSDYELIGYATATLVSSGEYTLFDLLRAQRNTVATGHATGDMFVNLTGNIVRVSVATSLIGQVVQVKCVSANQQLSSVTAQSILIASPTYSATSGITSAINASKTPFWRVRGYVGAYTSIGLNQTIDNTWFPNSLGTAGSNQPSGVTAQFWQESSLSPIEVSWRYDTSQLLLTSYLRINLTNPTASSITFNWWMSAFDNILRVRLNGSWIYDSTTLGIADTAASSSTSAGNTVGTASVAAGATDLLEIFYNNVYASGGTSAYASAGNNPGIGSFSTNAIAKGLTWSDAGT